MAVQNVANAPIGSYPVLVDKNLEGADLQVFRLDIGVGTDEDRVTSLNPLPITGSLTQTVTQYALKLDESASPVTYIGEAVPGSSAASAVWRIKKIDETSGLVITWADGSADFDQIWNDRSSLIYI